MTDSRDMLDAAIADGIVTGVPERGLPRPLHDHMPVPFAVEQNEGSPRWAKIDTKLTMLCTLDGRCHLCGDPVADAQAWAIVDLMGRAVDGWILHERCCRLALAHCPHLRDTAGHDLHAAPAGDLARKLRERAEQRGRDE